MVTAVIISVVGIISVVIGGHFGGGDHFDGGDHFGGGTLGVISVAEIISMVGIISVAVKGFLQPGVLTTRGSRNQSS